MTQHMKPKKHTAAPVDADDDQPLILQENLSNDPIDDDEDIHVSRVTPPIGDDDDLPFGHASIKPGKASGHDSYQIDMHHIAQPGTLATGFHAVETSKINAVVLGLLTIATAAGIIGASMLCYFRYDRKSAIRHFDHALTFFGCPSREHRKQKTADEELSLINRGEGYNISVRNG